MPRNLGSIVDLKRSTSARSLADLPYGLFVLLLSLWAVSSGEALSNTM